MHGTRHSTRHLSPARLLVALILIVCPDLCSAQQDAKKLVVSELATGYEKQLSLPPGATAQITVHLSSAGEVVGDYKVFVVRNSDRESVATGTSDPVGVIHFRNISAGEYTLVLSKTQRQRAMGSVQIGDFVLSLDKKLKSISEEKLGSERDLHHE